MKKIKVGIIGLGIGEKHIEGYQRHPQCEVVTLCDFDNEKCSLAREKYPSARIVKDAEEILQDKEIDVVSIASYDNYHFEHVVKAITHDKHVFVEKPLCLYENEAAHIRTLLGGKKQLQLSSNLILRMSPRFQLLKQIIDTGDMGNLYYVEGDYNYGRFHKIINGWRGKIDFYSVVYGGGIHMIDLLLWLTGDEIVEVAAYGNNFCSKNTGFHYDDMVVGIMKFKSGMIGKISANFGCVFPHFHAVSLYGTKATFINGLDQGTLFEAPGQTTGKKITADYPGTDKGALVYNFIDSILNGFKPEVSADDVFKTMSVCFAIEKATRTQCPVKVQYI